MGYVARHMPMGEVLTCRSDERDGRSILVIEPPSVPLDIGDTIEIEYFNDPPVAEPIRVELPSVPPLYYDLASMPTHAPDCALVTTHHLTCTCGAYDGGT